MTGVVDVGGGMRGIYGAGVYDYCMDNGISFDFFVGVSAGAANLCSFVAGQRGRNYNFYADYAFRKEYMGVGNLLRSGSYIDLEYIYGMLSRHDGENPLDYEAIKRSGKEMRIVATDAETGKAVYFTQDDLAQDNYDPVKASCCVPVVNRPYMINSRPYYDGGMSDPVPVNTAFRAGCDKVVLVLTRPVDSYRSGKKDLPFARLLQKKYPRCAARMARRAMLYNAQLDLAKKYQERGKLLILAPKDIGNMKTLTKNKDDMDLMYNEGYEDAAAIREFLKI